MLKDFTVGVESVSVIIFFCGRMNECSTHLNNSGGKESNDFFCCLFVAEVLLLLLLPLPFEHIET
jgi:hypothetical protein